MNSGRILLTLTLVSAAAACGGTDTLHNPPASKPKIVLFAANPMNVPPGETTILSYTVTGSDKVKIDIAGGANVLPESSQLEGTITSPPLDANTTFVLTASNDNGMTTSMVMVTVGTTGGPTVVSFTANPMMINSGESAVLSWQTTGAVSGRIEDGASVHDLMPGEVAAGSYTVMPSQMTIYRLVITDSAGTQAVGMATVSVNLGPAPQVTSFTAAPTSVNPGDRVTLNWTTTNATQISIVDQTGANIYSGTDANGSAIATPNADSTYTLTAMGNNQQTTATVMVTVMQQQGARVVSFTANPTSVPQGMTTELAWEVQNATGIEISDGTQVVHSSTDLTGMVTLTPNQTTTYTLTAMNVAGSANGTVTVTVIPPPGATIVSFDAQPATITAGDTTMLNWQVINADSVEIRDGTTLITSSMMLSGSFMVTPAQTTTYELTAINTNGNATMTTVVTVNAPPGATIISFTALPAMIPMGQSSVLSWQVQNATRVDISDGAMVVNTSMNLTGNFTVTPGATTSYTLTAVNTNGDAMATVEVTVLPPNNPTITAFTAATNPGALNGQSTLSWTTTNATMVRVLNGTTPLYSSTTNVATGSFAATLAAETNTFTLEASNSAGTVTQNVVVYAHPLPAIVSFTATPLVLSAAGQVTLSWSATDVSSISATANAVAIANFPQVNAPTTAVDSTGTFQVAVSTNTTFVFTAQSAAGMVTRSVSVNIVPPQAELEPNDNIGQANMLPMTGGRILGNLNPAGDLDVFSVVVADGANIRAQTSDGVGGCTTNTAIGLFDSNGLYITEDDNSGTAPCSLIDPTVNALAGNLPAGTYYILVLNADTPPGTGAYTLDVTVGAPACGNNIQENLGVAIAEQCDFGDTNNGDGCSNACQIEVNPTVISSPGGTVTVNLPTATSIATIRVNVTAGGSAISAVAADPGGTTCNNVDTAINLGDSVFNLIGGKADGGPNGTAGTCARMVDPTDAFNTDLPAGTYYLVVFNQGTSAAGPVDVQITLRGPACNNQLIEFNGGEQCDNLPNFPVPCNTTTCQVITAGNISLPSANTQVVSGALVANELDLIRLTLTEERYLRAETFAPTLASGCATANTIVQVYTDRYDLVSFDDDSGTGNCSLINGVPSSRLRPGSYWVIVTEAMGAALPAYEISLSSTAVGATPSFELEPNDTQATSFETGLSAVGTVSIEGTLNPNGDDDVYHFVVPANQARTINVRTYDQRGMPMSCAANNNLFDTRIFVEALGTEVSAPMTGELAYNDDISATQWCSALTGLSLAAQPTDTDLFVRVQGYNDGGFREYFLDINVQ